MRHADIAIDRKRHARIRFELAVIQLSLADVARQLGVGASVISSVSFRKSRSARIAKHLAKVLGVEVTETFPDRHPTAREGSEVGGSKMS